jgi:hypothetical protein
MSAQPFLGKLDPCLVTWHPREDAVTVSVEDARADRRLELAVERGRALDAFYHPFAYAA